MKIRILTLACVSTTAALLAACTAVYKNSDACEQLMRSKLAQTSSDTLKIKHTGAGIDGSRVVVEGSIEHVMTASEAAAARAASAAAARAASAVGAGRVAASEVRAAAQAQGPSSDKPKKVIQAAAAECTFHGPVLGTFSWLAPAKLAAPTGQDESESEE